MAAFKISFNNFNKNIKDIQKVIDNLLTPGEILQFATIAAKDIYNRTKEGKGVSYDVLSGDDAPKEEKLQPLSESYKNRRKVRGVRGAFGSPEKSNLTNTGQMLNAIKAVRNKGGASVIIADSSRDDSNLTNRDVALFASIVRPFFHLSDRQTANINKQIERLIRQKLRRANGR